MDQNHSEQIEELLSVWYRWQCRQSVAMHAAHYYRPADHTCRQYETPTSEVEDDEAVDLWAENQTGEQVQLCIDQLPFEQRAAVSNSLRNKELGYMVWRNRVETTADLHYAYQAAKVRIWPMLVGRGLVRVIADENVQ